MKLEHLVYNPDFFLKLKLGRLKLIPALTKMCIPKALKNNFF